MNPNDIARMAGQPQMGMVPIPRTPTAAEQVEIKRVERMNVRTQAGTFACQLYAGRSPTPDEWLAMARAIEAFIWGRDEADAAPARLPS